VNWKDDRDLTMLMLAAGGSSRPEVVKSLLDAGADVSARDQEGRTALDYAEQSNDGLESVRREIIILLKQGATKK
jgi:ankyrin repeat protein